MSDPSKISIADGITRLLIVEGTHENDLIEQLLADRSIDFAHSQILPIGGKNSLQKNLRALVRDPRFPNLIALGIVRDADSLPADQPPNPGTTAAQLAKDAILGCLRNVNLPQPPGDLNWAPGSPRVGILVLPDGVRDGMLETLCRESVSSSPEVPCVDGYFDCLQQIGGHSNVMEKAWTQVFIASQTEPDLPLGRAAKKGYWNLGHTAFDGLAAFLNELSANSSMTADGADTPRL